MFAAVEFDEKSMEQPYGVCNEGFTEHDDSSLSSDESQANNKQINYNETAEEENDEKAKEPVKVTPFFKLVREFVIILYITLFPILRLLCCILMPSLQRT